VTLPGVNHTQAAPTMPDNATTPIMEEASAAESTEPCNAAAVIGHDLGPIIGGRTVTHTIAGLLEAFINGTETISPRAVCERLNCSQTTAHRLLSEACEAGRLERAGRGSYQLVQAWQQGREGAVQQ
jgi:hypothetical protein